MTEVPRLPPRNPWMIGLTVLWSLLLLLALVFVILSAQAGSLGYDESGMPPADVLSGIYVAVAGVMFGIAVIVVAIQLGVGAVRWYLDPASRSIERELASGVPRPERQDF